METQSITQDSKDPSAEDKNSLEIYKHLREFERDFSNMQDGIRKLASGWLLATLGAIAYSYKLSPESYSFPIPPGLLASVSAFLGTIGILVLWIIDQCVYQNLLRAAYLEGCRFESLNPHLPQVRRTMWYISKHLNIGRFLAKNFGMGKPLSLFYFIPMFVLSVIGMMPAVLDSSLGPTEKKFAAVFGFTSLILATFVITRPRTDYKTLSKGHSHPEIDSWFKDS
jgi:hypothetical protein